VTDDKTWTDVQTDVLLNQFFNMSTATAMPTDLRLARYLHDEGYRPGTTEQSVHRRLWGLATAYANATADGPADAMLTYTPGRARLARRSTQWSRADQWVLELAFKRGGTNRPNPVGVAHVARVLGREPGVVSARADALLNTVAGITGLFPREVPK
jgi:hypothetical protein